MFIIIVGCLFGNRYVCKMDKHIVSLVLIIAVFLNAESGKAKVIQVNLQRAVASNKYIYSQVKLLTPDQKRIFEVLRNDIRLFESLVVTKGYF